MKVRTGKIEDSQSILDIQREVIEEGEYLIAVTDEIDKTLEQKRNQCTRY